MPPKSSPRRRRKFCDSRCRFMAPLGRADGFRESLFTRLDRKWPADSENGANDPRPTLAAGAAHVGVDIRLSAVRTCCGPRRWWFPPPVGTHERATNRCSQCALGSLLNPTSVTAWPDSAGNVKKADLLRMRVVERLNRLGGRLQQDRAALSRKIRLSFRR